MRTKEHLPRASVLQEKILEALAVLGGTASNDQLAVEVAKACALSPEDLALVHDDARGKRSEFEYRMAWARTKLKEAGLIENLDRKRWRLVGPPNAR